MMKRRWLAIAATAVLVLGLAGCGGSNSGSSSGAGTKANGSKSSVTQFDLDQVIYDQEGVTVTATGYQMTDNGNDKLLISVKNDTEYNVAVDETSITVNGFVESTYIMGLEAFEIEMTLSDLEVMGYDSAQEFLESRYYMTEPGETKDFEISVAFGDNELPYIGKVQQIQISMDAMKFTDMENEENLGAEEMPDGEVVTIETEEFDGELKLPEMDGTEIYNQNGIRIVALGMEYDSDYQELDIGLCIENNSEQSISLFSNQASVNDFMQDAGIGLYGDLLSGQKIITSLELRNMTDIEKVEDVESLECTIEINNAETYDLIDTVTYTYEK